MTMMESDESIDQYEGCCLVVKCLHLVDTSNMRISEKKLIRELDANLSFDVSSNFESLSAAKHQFLFILLPPTNVPTSL